MIAGVFLIQWRFRDNSPQISEVKIANFWKARRANHVGQEITSEVFT
jgi:hypothetical protein